MKSFIRIVVITFLFLLSTNLFANKFILTHMLGKKLTKQAYFFIGEQKVWTLDFNNGEKIDYTIISFQKDNLFCGIEAKDNFGDDCEICIIKNGDSATIEFKYFKKTVTFSGYYSKE